MNKVFELLGMMFTRSFQAYLFIYMFGFFAVAAFVAGFWNPWQFAACGLCLVLLLFAIVEFEKTRK